VGHASAQHNLAACYLTGTGVARDLAAARTWLTRAAAAGSAVASAAIAQLDAPEV
jgi:TPR repeat protein